MCAHVSVLAKSAVNSSFFQGLVEVGVTAAATGFLGLLIAGTVEAFVSLREDRPARWGESTVYGTLIAGAIGAGVEAVAQLS